MEEDYQKVKNTVNDAFWSPLGILMRVIMFLIVAGIVIIGGIFVLFVLGSIFTSILG